MSGKMQCCIISHWQYPQWKSSLFQRKSKITSQKSIAFKCCFHTHHRWRCNCTYAAFCGWKKSVPPAL